MQIGVISLEEPPTGLPYRGDIGTVRQLEVGIVARQLWVLGRAAACRGRRSCPGVISHGRPPLLVLVAPARTSDPWVPLPRTQPR